MTAMEQLEAIKVRLEKTVEGIAELEQSRLALEGAINARVEADAVGGEAYGAAQHAKDFEKIRKVEADIDLARRTAEALERRIPQMQAEVHAQEATAILARMAPIRERAKPLAQSVLAMAGQMLGALKALEVAHEEHEAECNAYVRAKTREHMASGPRDGKAYSESLALPKDSRFPILWRSFLTWGLLDYDCDVLRNIPFQIEDDEAPLNLKCSHPSGVA